jgi:hypothetical protein
MKRSHQWRNNDFSLSAWRAATQDGYAGIYLDEGL